MKNKNYYAVIMAGGVGSRFWPVSRSAFPKQFHDMLGTGQTLLQKTFSRIAKRIPQENIFILTNDVYADLVKEQLPKVTDRQIVLEPAMRNTAPCILLASLKIQKENPDAIMLVAPSDHWIEDESAFAANMQTSFDACQRQSILMTMGIKPTFPNTGYGYIKAQEYHKSVIKPVEKFTEKPDYLTAQKFLEEGNYLWNAGIFIWSVKSIVAAFQINALELYQLFERGLPMYNTSSESQFLEENYHLAENISIDYAILEKAKNVHTIAADFDWSDLGTWGSLHDKLPKNENENAYINTNRVIENHAKGNVVSTKKDKLVVLDGLDNYIIVDHEDALVIVPKNKEQEIKKIRRLAAEKYGSSFE
ncbi:MAG: mannose-1-phosphate guanylyltransferase [Bacteroidota bacterium]